jgi:uncharacterized protein (TIGR00369 family)
VALDGYPSASNFLADLGMEAEVTTETSARVRIPVTAEVVGADGGVRAGVLATLVDVVGGSAALRAVLPDWMATADLTVQTVRPAAGPLVEARADVVRRGRTTLVVEASVVDVPGGNGPMAGDPADPADPVVAWATMTFAVLPSRTGLPMRDVSTALPVRWSLAGAGLAGPVAESLGVVVDDGPAGRVSLPVHRYLHNSFGAVQGGVMALVAEVAALETLGAARGEPMVATGLQVAYLALGRIGPIVSRTRVLDPGTAGVGGSVVVEMVDRGADDRVTTVVNVAAAPLVPAAVGAGR